MILINFRNIKALTLEIRDVLTYAFFYLIA